MFEVYWDDSGTHATAPLAVAACYISTKRGWDNFVDEFDIIRSSEDFDCFHMADFAAYHSSAKKPWCDWDYIKRQRTYGRIAEAINKNKRIGFGFAVTKEPFDRCQLGTLYYIRAQAGHPPTGIGADACIDAVGLEAHSAQLLDAAT